MESQKFLKEEKIGKLIRKFSMPCVISMVVAALYNIVDQIFIGWSSAGECGNAATTIVFPFTVFALGFALMLGDGGCSNFSLYLGKKDNKRANNCVGLSFCLLIILSIIIMVLGLILKEPLLTLFGANKNSTKADEILCYNYAVDYYTVICIGIPFYMIGQGLNGSIRADGSPKYAMACTLAGAIANIILDPIFIFVFNTGVKGAAIATVIGQVITFIMSIIYLFFSKTFKLNKESFKFDYRLLKEICLVGLASLIVQLSIVVISTLNNNLFTKYGAQTIASTGNVYGISVPLAVTGIVLKVFGIVVAIAIGISLGGQPIIGYNMGEGDMDRVKECVKYITKFVLIVGAIAFLIFEFLPDLIIKIFGKDNSPEYIEFARLCIRIFLSGIILTCFIKSASIMLQAMGKSVKSTIVALTRDVIVFVPASITLAIVSKNIVTMLWASLIADVIGALVAFLLLYFEIKKQEKLLSNKKI